MPNAFETLRPTQSAESVQAGNILVSFTEGFEDGAEIVGIDLTDNAHQDLFIRL